MTIVKFLSSKKMSDQKTHWKKLVNPDYLGAYSLNPGQELILTIKELQRKKVKGSGGKEQECTVCVFVENIKPMILNRLNSKTITKIYQTPYIEDWVGKKIQVFAETIEAFGEMTDALRVRPYEPNVAPPLLPISGKHYDNAVAHLKKEGEYETLIADLRKHYTITEEIETKLKNDANII